MLSGIKRCRDDDHHLLRKRPKFQDDVAEDEADLVAKEEDDLVVKEDDDDMAEDDLVVKEDDDDVAEKVDAVAEANEDEDEDDSDGLAEFRASSEEEERKRRKNQIKKKKRKKGMQKGWQQPETITSLIDIEYYKKKPDEVWKEPPTELNLPLLWMVHCPTGKERELAVWLMQNSNVHDIYNHDIRSAISLDHHHNYIYVETGLERHVRKACKALDESYYATSKITFMSVEDTMAVLGIDSKSVDLSRNATHENDGNVPIPALPSTPGSHEPMIPGSAALYIPGGQPMSHPGGGGGLDTMSPVVEYSL